MLQKGDGGSLIGVRTQVFNGNQRKRRVQGRTGVIAVQAPAAISAVVIVLVNVQIAQRSAQTIAVADQGLG